MSEPIPEEFLHAAQEEDNDLKFDANFRMYEKEYPEENDVVVVKVNNVTDTGAYVTLLEYGGLDAMILASELSRRRIRSMNKVVRVGRIEYVMVLRVDKDKGFVDLSKRRVTEEEIAYAEARYSMSKQVHSILGRVAFLTNHTLEDLYRMFGWDLHRRFNHAFYAFSKIVNGDESCLDEYDEEQLPANVREYLVSIIKQRLTPQPILIRASIDVSCYSIEGIDAIKDALRAGEQCSTEAIPLKIRLLSPPTFTITTSALNQDQGIKLVEKAIEAISQSITQKNGSLVVREAPKVVSDSDEKKHIEAVTQLKNEGDEEEE